MEATTTQVLIVGGGPVGLTLAIDLGKRGIRCVLIEQKQTPQFLPKMERCNARSMEMFRRIGIADDIRRVGLRPDVPMDVYLIFSLNEPALLRLACPSVSEARAHIKATNDGTVTLEPYQLTSQYSLEPLLKSIAESLPCVTVRFGCEFLSLAQDTAGVTASVRTSGGSAQTLRADFLVGCDGGNSTVRAQLDIKLRGEGPLAQFRQALFRCDELFDRMPLGNGPGRGRHWHVADDKGTVLVMQDSTRHWTLNSAVDSDEEMKRMFERVVGVPVGHEMLACNPWRQNLLLATSYGAGRAFIAGDAAHLMIPSGALGMNTGVGDAFDISWKLAATLNGWGGPNLLRSYEIERRQVGERNVGASRFATLSRRKWRSLWRPDIRENTPAGQQSRAALKMVADIEQTKNQEMTGAELGYRYVDSPAIMDIPGGPEHRFLDYVPTTWPGARLPHVWLDDGSAIQDRIPTEGYTLLRLGGTPADSHALEAALRARDAPVTTLNVPDRIAREVYGHDLILLRPDMHVVWRGSALPDDVASMAATATGF
ncbi:MAG: 2-polyprenyl-6-methoxyphenol hydroxylase [Betaproteobacteria bacterium]|nr:2-polyprenyl-6-methoxyphenol hydroxylase [Betaproteobacteria bacterium]